MPRSGVRQHQMGADPAATDAPRRRFAHGSRRKLRNQGLPERPGRMVRNGFFAGDGRRADGRRRGRDPGRRARQVRLAHPVSPLTVPARLAAPLRAPVAPSRLAPVLDAGPLAAGLGTVPVPAVARAADHDLPTAPVAIEQTSRLAHIHPKSGVDPDAKLPDNAREFGPRDRLVRVRRRGLSPNNLARCRIALSFDATLPSGRSRGKGAAAGRTPRLGKGTIRKGAPQRRPMPDPRLRLEPNAAPAQDPGRRSMRTTEASRKEPYDRSRTMGKGNDSGKSAACHQYPALFHSRRQTGWPTAGAPSRSPAVPGRRASRWRGNGIDLRNRRC